MNGSLPINRLVDAKIIQTHTQKIYYQLMISEAQADAARLLFSAWLCFMGLARTVSLGHDRDACTCCNAAAAALKFSGNGLAAAAVLFPVKLGSTRPSGR